MMKINLIVLSVKLKEFLCVYACDRSLAASGALLGKEVESVSRNRKWPGEGESRILLIDTDRKMPRKNTNPMK